MSITEQDKADRVYIEKQIAGHVESIMDLLLDGSIEVPDHPHFKDTPKRFAKALVDLTTPHDFNFTTFPNGNAEGENKLDQMVVVQDIEYWTLCAHHMLPFYGKAHIGYIPDKTVCGLSKLARTVVHFMRGLNIQEELTQDIHDFLDEHLSPKGVMVVLEGNHMCMGMRGVERPAAVTTTSAISGVFLDPNKGARGEFLRLVKK